jgi:hypothetical protein
MAIINMFLKTSTKVVEFVIIIEEELPMRQKNMVKYHHNDFDSNEFDDSNDENEHHEKKTKKKSKKVDFDIVRRKVYCQKKLNEGNFTKECKL